MKTKKRKNTRTKNKNGCLAKGLLVILAVVFFPITITVYIFKSKMSTKAKLISSVLLWALVFIIGGASASHKNDPSTDSSSKISRNRDSSSQIERSLVPETEDSSLEIAESASENNESKAETSITTTTTKITTTEPVIKTDTELGIDYPRPDGKSELKVGSDGDEVRWLQEALNRTMDYKITVDGSYKDDTASKVKEFQERCDLSANGIADAATIKMLVDILLGNKALPEPPVIVTDPPVTQPPVETQATTQNNIKSYVANTNTHKFHEPYCSSVEDIKPENRWDYEGSRDDLIAQGYQPCKRCNP